MKLHYDNPLSNFAFNCNLRRYGAARQCYTCKARFTALHHFYAQFCPACAALNFRMRHAAADLRGRVALLTGARVKIGFEIGLVRRCRLTPG